MSNVKQVCENLVPLIHCCKVEALCHRVLQWNSVVTAVQWFQLQSQQSFVDMYSLRLDLLYTGRLPWNILKSVGKEKSDQSPHTRFRLGDETHKTGDKCHFLINTFEISKI